MENLILSDFPHSLAALDNHKPLWALSCLPTFVTSFNHSIAKKTRHVVGNGTQMDKGKVFSWRPHTYFEVCSSGRNLGPEPYLYLLCRQSSKRSWRAGMEKHMVRLAILGPWWGGEASLMEWAFKVIRNYNRVCHMTPSGKRPSEFKRKENNLAFNPQLKFRWSWKVTGLRLTPLWSKLLCEVFHWKKAW